jgi:hypothetical protein
MARREVLNPETDTAARTHDSSLFKTLMHALGQCVVNGRNRNINISLTKREC